MSIMEKCGKKQIIVKKVNRMRKKKFLTDKNFHKSKKVLCKEVLYEFLFKPDKNNIRD